MRPRKPNATLSGAENSDLLCPRFSELALILTSMLFEEEEEVEADEDGLRGAGVGGKMGFFLMFLSIAEEQTNNRHWLMDRIFQCHSSLRASEIDKQGGATGRSSVFLSMAFTVWTQSSVRKRGGEKWSHTGLRNERWRIDWWRNTFTHACHSDMWALLPLMLVLVQEWVFLQILSDKTLNYNHSCRSACTKHTQTPQETPFHAGFSPVQRGKTQQGRGKNQVSGFLLKRKNI